MEIKDHFGVYGVCLQDGKLLCIEKTRGPYRHRFDLPGGSQEPGEGLTANIKLSALSKSPRFLFSLSIKCQTTMPLRKGKEISPLPIGGRFTRNSSRSGWRKRA